MIAVLCSLARNAIQPPAGITGDASEHQRKHPGSGEVSLPAVTWGFGACRCNKMRRSSLVNHLHMVGFTVIMKQAGYHGESP